MKKKLYKITFHNHVKIYELYAHHISSSEIWGFTVVSDLVFDQAKGLVVDPTEEKLRDEFVHTKSLHLPMQSIVRIEEVEKRGQLSIRDASTGEKITPFPMPVKRE